jgi:hypothetical protein
MRLLFFASGVLRIVVEGAVQNAVERSGTARLTLRGWGAFAIQAQCMVVGPVYLTEVVAVDE